MSFRSPRARRRSLSFSQQRLRRLMDDDVLITEEELEEIGRDPIAELSDFMDKIDTEYVQVPPKGFSSWEQFFVNRRYGEEEYHYKDVHIGNNTEGGREQLQIGGFGSGEPYGYNGYPLHVRVVQGYDRTECVGREIELRSMDLTMSIQIQDNFNFDVNDHFVLTRIFIVTDTQAAEPGNLNTNFANLRSDTTVTTGQALPKHAQIYSHYDLENLGRYKVLYDKIHQLPTGKSKYFSFNKFNDNGSGKTQFAMQTMREAGTNLYQFACENGQEIESEARALDAYVDLNLDQVGDLAGALPPDAVYTGTIGDALFGDSTLQFGRVYVQPGRPDAGGEVTQEQFEGVLSLNPVTQFHRRDTAEFLKKIHIDFEDTFVQLKTHVVDGVAYNYFEDNAIYIGFQTISRTYSWLGLYCESRLTFWNN